MVKLPLMSFGDYTWRYNPGTLQVSLRRSLREWRLPMASSMIQDLGREKRVVTGQGELFGEDCLQQFQRLASLCAEGGERLLTVPGIDSFPAYLYTVSMVGEARPDLVGYRFEFWESQKGNLAGETALGKGYHTAGEGQTLWEIGSLYGVSVTELIRLNPGIKRPDLLVPGQKVRLR